jgi:DNA-directed RNA polymerase subunit RPC12/RpoP
MPEQPTPAAPQAPPPGRQFPCIKCGARLDFDPAVRALHCPYCGYTQTIAPADRAVREHDFESEVSNLPEATLPGRSCEVKCNTCGAVVLLEDKVATDRCPYCGSHLENKPQAAEKMVPPEAVLPFAVDSRKATGAFATWIAGLWFAPNELKKLADLGRLDGVYVPFWTFDSMTYTHYTGQRGEDYQVTETYTERDAQGNLVTKERTVTHTRWYSVSGEVQHFFDDVLVCASRSIPEHFVRAWMPKELRDLEPFRPDYLSGFKTERYTVGPREGFGKAKQIMDGTIRQLCCQQIGGDHQRLETVHTQHVGVTFKHILLPVWLASYRYRGQSYRVLINGRTGAVQGDRPYSWAKILLLIAFLVAVIVAIILLINLANRGGPRAGRHAPTVQEGRLDGVNPATGNLRRLSPGTRGGHARLGGGLSVGFADANSGGTLRHLPAVGGARRSSVRAGMAGPPRGGGAGFFAPGCACFAAWPPGRGRRQCLCDVYLRHRLCAGEIGQPGEGHRRPGGAGPRGPALAFG